MEQIKEQVDELYAWHFLPGDGKTRHLHPDKDGVRVRILPGQTLHVSPPIVMCERGLHGSSGPLDALNYTIYGGNLLVTRVRLWGGVHVGNDKAVAPHRTCLWMADPTPVLHEFACCSVEQALSLVAEPDPRSINALAVKRAWLRDEATNNELATARAAASSAVRDAAFGAAGAVVRVAARVVVWHAAFGQAGAVVRAAARATNGDAAWDAQNAKLHKMLMSLKPEGALDD